LDCFFQPKRNQKNSPQTLKSGLEFLLRKSYLINTNFNYGFVAKLLDTGNAGTFAWAQSFGGGFSRSTALAVAGANVYVAGSFNGITSFGNLSLIHPGTNVANGFVAKLMAAGSSSFTLVQQAAVPEAPDLRL